MNIYKSLNDITEYIENNLENDIDYNILAKMLGVNTYTMHRLFAIITNISLSEYIRKRRLSCAGIDLCNNNIKVIDVAFKYGYENATSFSRAFEKFHGIKPSMVNKETKLKIFPKLTFNEEQYNIKDLEYEIVTLEELHLYGCSINTNNKNIGIDAPNFFKEMDTKYNSKYGDIVYGMITYDIVREESQKYYCLYDKEIKEFEEIIIPKSKWLRFIINSQDPLDIQNKSYEFYKYFLPSCNYNLKELPELEYYHDDITEFLVAIY